MRFPIAGDAGDFLAVMPPAFRDNLWMLEGESLWVIRRRAVEEGKLWSMLNDKVDEGTLTLLHAPGRRLLGHLVESGQITTAQALRVLRAG
jgi:hypothetical protein